MLNNIINNPMADSFKEKLVEGMMFLFDIVIKERKDFHKKHKETRTVDQIINDYANKNAIISGGTNIVPFLNILTSVPETLMIIRNQLSMIYDISVVLNKSHHMNKELMTYIFSSAEGKGLLSMVSHSNDKLTIRKVSLNVFEAIVGRLSVRITQNLLKKTLAKFIPMAGAVVMAGWSRMTTAEIGKKASEILSKDIEISDDEVKSINPDDLS